MTNDAVYAGSGRGGQDLLVIHDYVTQQGGAERVALLLGQTIGRGRLLTSVYLPDSAFGDFQQLEIRELLPRLPAWVKSRRSLLAPFLLGAMTFASAGTRDVLCSSSGWAHWIRTTGRKTVYCYSPPRWLYAEHDFFLGSHAAKRKMLTPALAVLRLLDVRQARSAHRYIAISTVTQNRIKQAYGIDAPILAPPVTIDGSGPQTEVEGLAKDFYLCIARPRQYKNTSLIEQAFKEQDLGQVVLVGGTVSTADDRVRRLGRVSDSQLRWLYANCRATIAMSYEDFGLTPVEGHLFGKPAVALAAGGYLDTCREGQNAILVGEPTVQALTAALRELQSTTFDHSEIAAGAMDYSPDAFLRKLDALLRAA